MANEEPKVTTPSVPDTGARLLAHAIGNLVSFVGSIILAFEVSFPELQRNFPDAKWVNFILPAGLIYKAYLRLTERKERVEVEVNTAATLLKQEKKR